MNIHSMTKKEPLTVVLGNGSYPTHEVPLQLLQSASFLLCCDGAVNQLTAHGVTPDFIIGDGDSIAPELKQRYADRFLQVADQETNDQTKAMNYLMQKGVQRVALVGATGGREDHTLGNVSLLMDYLRQGMEVRMFTDTGVFIPARGETLLEVEPGTQISIFRFDATSLSAEGLKYPLYDFTAWWQGTLNEAVEPQVTFRGEGDYLLFIAY
jgi:thiamine pyrophosphokinase